MKCPECGEKLKITAYAQCAIDCEISDNGKLFGQSETRVLPFDVEYECFYCGINVNEKVIDSLDNNPYRRIKTEINQLEN